MNIDKDRRGAGISNGAGFNNFEEMVAIEPEAGEGNKLRTVEPARQSISEQLTEMSWVVPRLSLRLLTGKSKLPKKG